MKMDTNPRKKLSKITLLAALVVALGISLAACSSSSKSSSPSSSSGADITIRDFAFTAKSVKAGATVTVQNTGSVTHTVTANNGSFNITIDAGKSATFTAPATAGSYKFHCSIHPQMVSTLTVT